MKSASINDLENFCKWYFDGKRPLENDAEDAYLRCRPPA